MNTVRRVSYVFLCLVPFLTFVVAGVAAAIAGGFVVLREALSQAG